MFADREVKVGVQDNEDDSMRITSMVTMMMAKIKIKIMIKPGLNNFKCVCSQGSEGRRSR